MKCTVLTLAITDAFEIDSRMLWLEGPCDCAAVTLPKPYSEASGKPARCSDVPETSGGSGPGVFHIQQPNTLFLYSTPAHFSQET